MSRAKILTNYCVVVATRGTDEAIKRIADHIVSMGTDIPVTIILNRGQNRNLYRTIEQIEQRYTNVTVFNCEGGGVSRARNLGLRLVEQDSVVFLDDDVIPSRAAIETLVGRLAQPVVGVATGRVLPIVTRSSTFELYRDLVGLDRGGISRGFGGQTNSIPHPMRAWELGVGAAFAVRRSRLNAVETPPIFDETLSNGRFCGGAEDTDFFLQCVNSGIGLEYCADAEFLHSYSESMRDLARKMSSYARADGAFYCKWRGGIAQSDIVGDLQGWVKRLLGQRVRRSLEAPRLPVMPLLLEPVFKIVGAVWWRCFRTS